MTVDHLFALDSPWPHQLQGVGDVIRTMENGTDSLCLTSPTGSGKTACMIALTQWATEKGWKVLVFTNRILLTEQTRRVFHGEGVLAGVISASLKQFEYEEGPVQIATMQTILSRRRADASYWVDADLVLVDEIHQQSTGESAALLQEYKDRGAKVCGVTATPLGVSNVCDKLTVAAGTRDLQEAGILCSAYWFAPSELDTRKLVKGKVDLSLTENQARRTWGGDNTIRTRIVGSILDHYKRIHPDLTHTLAFAPGVKESVWAAQLCFSRGIRALHIDGKDFWCDGQVYDRKRHDNTFQNLMQEWRDGAIPIIWNRFVMREGIDEPLMRHIILATPIGSYRSFLQMVGRALRVSELTPRTITVQDHGGCLDDQSEILTRRGWLGIDEVTDDDIIGTMNLDTSEFQWCANEGTLHKQHTRGMIETKPGTPHLDLRVTDYHQMVMTPDNRHCKWRKQDASDLAARQSVCQVPVSLIEDVPPCELTDSELTFIGWYFTDGGMDSDRIRIYQAETAPQKHHDSIVACLEGCGFRYSVRKRTRPTRFGGETREVSYGVSSGKKSKGGYKRLTRWLDKSFSLDAFDMLDRRQFGVLLHAMNLGDGCKHAGYNQQTVTLAVARKDAADNIQSLAVRRGYRCNIAIQRQEGDARRKPSQIHLLHIRDTQHAHIMPGTLGSGYITLGERVWCVQTANGTLICRRHGKVCVMGNSWWRHGSVNINVDWESVFECSDPDVLSKNRIAQLRETGDSVGQACPKCGMVHKSKGRFLYCQYCGHELSLGKPSRTIIQTDGTLTEVNGEPIKRWKIKVKPENERTWAGLYHNAMRKKKGELTFNQLYQQFGYKTAVEQGSRERPAWWKAYYPPRDLPLMPVEPNDWHDKIRDVTNADLH